MASFTAAWAWAFRKALHGIAVRKAAALLAFAVTTLALSCPLIAFTLARGLYAPVSSISPAQELTIFMKRSAGEERTAELQASVSKMPGITQARLVTPSQALALLGDTAGDADAQPSDNPLPYVILATADTAAPDSTVKTTAASIEKAPGVDSVAFDGAWNSRLAALRRAFTEFGLAAGCVLGALLLFVLVCSASLLASTTPARAAALRTMGASSAFISRPDAWRGALIFALSALASLAASSVIVSRVAGPVTEALGLYSLPVAIESVAPAWQAAFLLASAFLGALLSGISSLIESHGFGK